MPKPTTLPQLTNIREILKAEMAAKGMISFARFMELALYCPNFGYYERPDAAPGQSGDFYTSVSVGELFGELLARQFTEWIGAVPDQPRQILEAGAHDGRLAADILKWLRAERPNVADQLEYWILEPSARRRESQMATLKEFSGTVRWFESWDAVPSPGMNGIICANELLDAMPVHRLGWDAKNKKWFEWGVRVEGDEFIWTRMEGEFKIKNSKLKIESDLLSATPFTAEAERGEESVIYSALRTPHSALEAVLPDGFTTEICPLAENWWRQAARALKSGKLITFDYGLSAEEFFAPGRKDGTLRAYYKHHQSADVLARPGEQDITAQVNFTAIQTAGEGEGLKTEIMTTQGRFLTGIVERAIANKQMSDKWTSARIRQFQTLTHPEHLGRAFRVLIHGR